MSNNVQSDMFIDNFYVVWVIVFLYFVIFLRYA